MTNLLDYQFEDLSELEWARKQPSARAWSGYQEAVFDSVKASASNLIIQAVAGSGKTTTLVEAMRFTLGRTLFMAFNKSIALDIAQKAPSSAAVKTLNALGHWQWMQHQPSAKLESRKVYFLLKKIMPEEDFKEYGYSLSRVVGLAKNCAFGIQAEAPRPEAGDDRAVFELSPDLFSDLIDSYQFDVPFERLDEFSGYCARALAMSSRDLEVLDFDDQLYMPALLGWDYPSYDTVMVDEAQDLSPIQHVMLERLAQRGARIIAVGDRHQAIYGFRGASHNSMDLLKDKFLMSELPLSICYRCDQEIIREAKSYCPTIEARTGAGAGSVIIKDDADPELFTNQLIVCRNNAPLFRSILHHYRAKTPCRVLSNFLESFQGFIRGFKASHTSELRTKLDSWYYKEVEAAKAKRFKGKLAALEDKYETVKLLSEEFSLTEDLIKAVKRLGEGTAGPVFATIHKAKGLEQDSVYILRPDLLPSKWANSPEAKQQEANLSYVAITRAKHELTFGVMER